MAKDPVCGMAVDVKKAKAEGLVAKKNDRQFYFCSKICRDKFNSKLAFSLTEIVPAAVLIVVAVAVAALDYMLLFMGIAFLVLACLKLIDLRGFAQMFVQYDVLASRIKGYAFAYPFIELALGTAYLINFQVQTAALITLIVMSVGAVGVAKNLLSNNKVRCACLGSKIKVPLTTFTLVEDIIMAGMALMILFL